ncbi:hypothetical protein ASG60_18755 [Methylobacterium sp. Leaf469]|uniref:beta strand repeat-containing protein n=1 Tax=Methylobacterium sp. Leaf469 TaxID=1736387 RepID=UPI000701C369|nr:calcium-binding protein [Methylobacterium sp. Leaf469]KQU01079.1 hypothetical protein ASG60_18755 [Methylobacterium sp. Leaf469]
MANFFFDGTANVTAAKSDNVLITANPALFTSEAQVGGNVVITYTNGTTLTVTGASLADGSTALPGVQLASGTFSSGSTAAITSTTPNALIFAPNAGAGVIDVSGGGTATSIKTVFGGLGVSDPNDTADAIQIGGKGSFLVYGNAGADTITQAGAAAGAFDSTSFVTVFGGKNDAAGLQADTITLANAGNLNAKFAVYGGEGTDTISVFNTGANANTAIFGGQGAADSLDSADTITFNGGGTVNIFGNAGNDTINVGTGTALDSTSNVTVHGGLGADGITIAAGGTAGGEIKVSITAFGDQNDSTTGADSITISGNGGSTTIYGGVSAADSADGADVISFSGQGTTFIYAAGGNDTVVVNTAGTLSSAAGVVAGGTAVAANSASVTNVFLGNGNDSINVLNATADRGFTTVAGGAGNDSFGIGSTADSATLGAVGTGLTVTITDFGTGNDTLQINNGVVNGPAAAGPPIVATTSAPIAIAAPATAFGTLQAALNAAASAGTGSANAAGTAGAVGVVVFNSDTYVVVNNSAALVGGNAFDAATDFAVKLTGVSQASAATAALITVV